ncbi:MAG: peptide deformylase [Clostridiaceae bacterium]|nr:peptide deformylase [Clostridiaceae bacterium]
MAIRNIRKDNDEVLRKVCKQVEVIDERVLSLLKDMADTMYDANGVGLAAPQVGILKRLVVIDTGDGLLELINPKIVSEEGEIADFEGCLSLPGLTGEVVRPEKVVVEAKNTKGEDIVIEGRELLARALCHEIDHLNGIVFTDKAERLVDKEELENRRKK